MENIVNAPFHGQSFSIIINGKKFNWIESEYITYEQLFFRAYPDIKKVMNFSACYEYPQNMDKRGKIFHPGEKVKLYSGMIFNIINTSNA
jgi:hypothetical protein